jgi:glycosyltransferase involved in cell wall biosynthesis
VSALAPAPAERLRINLVAPEFPPELGGMQTYAAHLAAELARAGHAVRVFAKAGAAPVDGVEVIGGLELRRRHDLPLFERYPADVWHVLNAGYAWLASQKAPVFASVYGNDFLWPWVLAENLDLPMRLGLPFGTRCDRRVGRWLTGRALHRGFARVRHTFACSRYSEVAFLKRYPQCRGRTSAAYVGVSPRFAPPERRRSEGEPIELVTVCRLSDARKNVDVVLRALALLESRFSFRYTIVGDGEFRPELEALCRSLNLSDRVRFVGRVSDADLHRHLASGDLFVLTSGVSLTSFEGFGIVYLEANACGVPVLAARCGGAVEAVEEGVSGWFVEDITPESVAAALGRFFRGEVRFASEECRRFAQRFTWQRVGEHVLAEYQKARTCAAVPA